MILKKNLIKFNLQTGKEIKEETYNLLDTDFALKMSWKGDGQYFLCSFINADGKRQFRVWDRDMELQYTSDILQGIEMCIAWKPSGSFIAAPQRTNTSYNIILFETNGLKYSEFTLPFAKDEILIKEMQWDKNSEVLMVYYEAFDPEAIFKSGIMLWTVSNCHWMLKQSLKFSSTVSATNFQVPLTLKICVENHLLCYFFQYELCSSNSLAYDDNQQDPSYIAVIEGNKVKLTPFSYVGIPPPMCCYEVVLKEDVQSVTFCQAKGHTSNMAVLTCNDELFLFSHKDFANIFNDVKVNPLLMGPKNLITLPGCYKKQILLVNESKLRHLPGSIRKVRWVTPNIFVATVSKKNGGLSETSMVCFDFSDGSFITTYHNVDFEIQSISCFVLNNDEKTPYVFLHGLYNTSLFDVYKKHIIKYELYSLNIENAIDIKLLKLNNFTEIDDVKILTLDAHKNLYVNDYIISKECTSFVIGTDFVMITTSSHKLLSIPISILDKDPLTEQIILQYSSERSLERGSVIVSHPAHTTKLVLQLPRGNLEIIHPR